jgi:hypothetical protein
VAKVLTEYGILLFPLKISKEENKKKKRKKRKTRLFVVGLQQSRLFDLHNNV